jgi:hypothetical protein
MIAVSASSKARLPSVSPELAWVDSCNREASSPPQRRLAEITTTRCDPASNPRARRAELADAAANSVVPSALITQRAGR